MKKENWRKMTKIKIAIILSLLFFCITLFSIDTDINNEDIQLDIISNSAIPNVKIDSLEQLLTVATDDSSRAEILIQLGLLFDKYNLEKSIDYFVKAVELFDN